MKPYYDRNGITIFHADCRDVLPTLEPGSVDLVLTDPPYGLGFQYGAYEDNHANLVALIRDAVIPAIAISKRSCILPGITQLFLYPEPDWIVCISWDTTGSFGKFGYSQWMPALVYGADLKGFGSVNNMLKSDVIRFSGGAGVGFMRQGDSGHPCPKPSNLMRCLVSRMSNIGDVILDPFMGSGTTLRAAKDLGRRAIGIEIEEKYCRIAALRLQQDVMPLEVQS